MPGAAMPTVASEQTTGRGTCAKMTARPQMSFVSETCSIKLQNLDLRPISAKRGSCSICNCIRARGGGSQMKEMRLVQHLLRVSVFLYSKQNKGTVCLVPLLFTVISQMKA